MSKKEFTPFEGGHAYDVVPPIRKHVKKVYSILARTDDIPASKRIEFIKASGQKTPEKAEDIKIDYTAEQANELLCCALFDIEYESVADWDLLNEGEVARALSLFFKSRIGIY